MASGVVISVTPATRSARLGVAQPTSDNTETHKAATIDEAKIFTWFFRSAMNHQPELDSVSGIGTFLHFKAATDRMGESLGGGGAVAEEH